MKIRKSRGKSFITLAPGVNVSKLFTSSFGIGRKGTTDFATQFITEKLFKM
jgi:hypothetical protein